MSSVNRRGALTFLSTFEMALRCTSISICQTWIFVDLLLHRRNELLIPGQNSESNHSLDILQFVTVAIFKMNNEHSSHYLHSQFCAHCGLSLNEPWNWYECMAPSCSLTIQTILWFEKTRKVFSSLSITGHLYVWLDLFLWCRWSVTCLGLFSRPRATRDSSFFLSFTSQPQPAINKQNFFFSSALFLFILKTTYVQVVRGFEEPFGRKSYPNLFFLRFFKIVIKQNTVQDCN